MPAVPASEEFRQEPDDELAACREELDQLRTALDSRATIDEAKGILMAAHRIDDDQAWQLLTRVSQNHNVKVAALAAALADLASKTPHADSRATAIARQHLLGAGSGPGNGGGPMNGAKPGRTGA